MSKELKLVLDSLELTSTLDSDVKVGITVSDINLILNYIRRLEKTIEMIKGESND